MSDGLQNPDSKPGPKVGERKGSNHRAGKPAKPVHLTGVASEKWDELVKVLHKRRVLTKADGTQLEIVCVQYANWVRLQEEIATEGVMVDTVVLNSSGVEIRKTILNPALKAANALENSMRATLQQLGATPATREKTTPAHTPKPKKAPLTPEEEFMQRAARNNSATAPEPEEHIEVDDEEDDNE
jgi:P27 family predicted phage terminase small subunit